MGLFKFQNYSAIKNAQDNPRVIASATTVNGNVFSVVDTANAASTGTTEVQTIFANADAAKGEVWVMNNIVDKPELDNYADYNVTAGEYIRAFKLNNLVGEKVELSSDLVVPAAGVDAAVGVALVPCNLNDDAANPMSWKTIDDPDGYSVYLEITGLTTFGLFTVDNSGVGYEAKIKTA
jgi:hypothetical protein